MGLFDKFKEIFTEEIEDEPVVRREVRHVEPPKPEPKREEPIRREYKPEPEVQKQVEPEVKEETKEDKFVFFSDDDFKDLEKPKREVKPLPKREEVKPKAYQGAVPQTKVEPKKEFKPSPIISPVYGVLDKNYNKDEIKPTKTSPRVYRSSTITIDDVRNKAYGTLEDEISDDILGKAIIGEPEQKEADINIFDELDKYDEDEVIEPTIISHSTADVDEIFGKLDSRKDEILDELDNKKDEILDEIDSKKENVSRTELNNYDEEDDIEEKEIDTLDEIEKDNIKESINEEETADNKDELDNFDEDTEALAKELEEQKKKLEEINSMMEDNEEVTKKKKKSTKKTKKEEKEEDLNESELFDIIDSMYEKEDDE